MQVGTNERVVFALDSRARRRTMPASTSCEHGAKPPMPIDVERARRDTPATDKILHFNNAGAALMPTPVLQAQLRHLQLEAETGGYEAAAAEDDRIEAIYDSIARLLNADRAEIALVENATVAWDMAFYSIGFAPGDRILIAEAEYLSNQIAFQQVTRRTGAVIDVVPSDEAGEFDVEALERMIDRRVKLIAITHVPSNGGLINPAASVGRIARAHGILYLLDACQSVGQLPIDVAAIGCDMLSATGRKYLRGPRGTGFLYVRSGVLDRLEPPFLDLQAVTRVEPDRYEMRPDARRFENWERNVAAQLGLGSAVEYALGWGLADIAARIETLVDELRRRLAEIPGVSVRDSGRRLCGIVTFTVEGKAPRDIVAALRQQHINCHPSGPSSPLLVAPARRLPALVRASVHYYNTEEEVARFALAVAALA
jgi:cysteine desulfurase / selenocysteine lyase